MLVELKVRRGFTLVELAMVLFIVSLLLGSLLVPLSTKLEQANRDSTTVILEEIKETLLGYAIVNGRLPCPDCPDGNVGGPTGCTLVAAANRNDGIEDRFGAPLACRTAIGNLPWVDLQVPEHDAWNRHFTYSVSAQFSRTTNPGGGACTPAIGVSFDLCSTGVIQINNTYAAPVFTPPATVAANVPAIVISHGADAYEPVQTNQQVENYDRDPENPDTGANIIPGYTAVNFEGNIFIYTDYAKDTSLTPSTQFDDLVMWISPNLLFNRMVVAGQLP